MRRTISTTCLLLAWLCANGAVWNVVQVVAWAKMFHDYSQVMPVADALELTFDGSAPCDMCTIAQDGQDTARSQLFDAEFVEFDGLDEEDALHRGFSLHEVQPPQAESDDALRGRMVLNLGSRA